MPWLVRVYHPHQRCLKREREREMMRVYHERRENLKVKIAIALAKTF